MTVRVSKPAFNLRDKLSELDKPTGIHGTQLMRSSDIEESFDLVGAGRKNLFINGSTIVWQRGTSNPNVSNYGCDRWWFANGATRVDRSTTVPDGFPYSMKVTSNGNTTSIGQPIELTSTGRSQFEPNASYTLSFYARTDSGTNAISATVYYRNGKYSGTNQVNWGPTVTQNMGTMTTSFQRFSKTFTAPSAPHANNQMLAVELNNSATYYITGIQFEKGKAITPFEHRSYGEELALCKRYYQVLVDQADTGSQKSFGIACAYSSTSMHSVHPLRPPMRTTPTIDYTTGSNYYKAFANNTSDFYDSMSLVGNSHVNAVDLMVSSGLSVTQGNAVLLRTQNDASRIAFSAEL